MKKLSFLFNAEGKLFSSCPTLVSTDEPKVFISYQPDESYRFQVGMINPNGGTTDYKDVDRLQEVKDWLKERDLRIDMADYDVSLFKRNIREDV
jgi:hypothetical protein